MLTDIHDVEPRRIDADVCLIGAGAAGIAIARELDGSPLRVVVLEAGRRGADPEAQKLYRADVVGLTHGGVHGYRYRGIGGSTVAWAGQLSPFEPIDFEHRDWIPFSGWPVTRDELDPYYARVASALRVPPFQAELPEAIRPASLETRALTTYYSEFAPEPDFSKLFGDVIGRSQNVTFVQGANVVQLASGTGAGMIETARVLSLGGRELEVAAGTFVVCGGGIEVARLLLASNVGNDRDLVGRFFHDHPGVVVGSVHPRRRAAVQTWAPKRIDGVKYAVRTRLADDLQRRERLAHAGAVLVFERGQSPSVAAGKTLVRAIRRRDVRSEVPRALATTIRHPVSLAAATARYARGRSALDAGVAPALAVGGEQVPNRESRIMLTRDRDAVGMPRVALDWRLSELDLKSYRRAAELAAEAIERSGLASVDLDGFRLPDDPAAMDGLAADQGHHMGATRMAERPDDGVVDPDCRVFGVDNLYVASCSVFPTGGTTNPTFTMLALALRLADRLRGHA